MQVLRDLHGLERTDTRSAGVSNGNPYPGKQDRCDHAWHLADDFAVIALAQAGAQHQPMHVGVAQGSPLSEHMRAFKMGEADTVIPPRQGSLRERYFF